MNKIVYSPRYGGFGLSDEAMELYLNKAGIEYVAVNNNRYGMNTTTFMHKKIVENPRFQALTRAAESGTYANSRKDNMLLNSAYIIADDIKRHDKYLVEVVEELGEAANSSYSNLQIEEIESDLYTIDEYDGYESVTTPDEMKWENCNEN